MLRAYAGRVFALESREAEPVQWCEAKGMIMVMVTVIGKGDAGWGRGTPGKYLLELGHELLLPPDPLALKVLQARGPGGVGCESFKTEGRAGEEEMRDQEDAVVRGDGDCPHCRCGTYGCHQIPH